MDNSEFATQVVALYKAGASRTQIRHQLHCALEKVDKILFQAGISLRRETSKIPPLRRDSTWQRLTPEQIQEAARRIREECWIDEDGVLHEPWDDATFRERAGLLAFRIPQSSLSRLEQARLG